MPADFSSVNRSSYLLSRTGCLLSTKYCITRASRRNIIKEIFFVARIRPPDMLQCLLKIPQSIKNKAGAK
jgi:hypothetical protein